MFDTLYTQIGAVLMVAVSAFAFIAGEDTERTGAGFYVFAWFASILLQDELNLYQSGIFLFLIDTAVISVFIALSWRSKNSWPVWAACLQLLPVLSHILARFDMRPPAWSFYAIQNLASLGILVAITAGTFWVWQERRAANFR